MELLSLQNLLENVLNVCINMFFYLFLMSYFHSAWYELVLPSFCLLHSDSLLTSTVWFHIKVVLMNIFLYFFCQKMQQLWHIDKIKGLLILHVTSSQYISKLYCWKADFVLWFQPNVLSYYHSERSSSTSMSPAVTEMIRIGRWASFFFFSYHRDLKRDKGFVGHSPCKCIPVHASWF